MPTVSRQTRTFDRSALSAYIGAGAAIAFIAAMTIGAIDAPSEHGASVADVPSSQATHVVSAAPVSGNSLVR